MQSTLFEEMRNDHKRMTRRSWLLIFLSLALLVLPMIGCAASSIKVNADGLDVADPNPFGETQVSYLKMHKTATTLDVEAADYGKTKSTVVQALALAAGVGTFALTKDPVLASAAGLAGAGAGYLTADKPTTSSTAAIVNALAKSQAVQQQLPAAVAP